jgi:hypothetical protein
MHAILKNIILESPDGHIDPVALQTIKEWDDEPTAIQILKTLDMCVHGGLSSGFVIGLLEQLLNQSMKKENVKVEDLIKKATWRHE